MGLLMLAWLEHNWGVEGELLPATARDCFTGHLGKLVDVLVGADLAASLELLAVCEERMPQASPFLAAHLQSLARRLAEYARAFIQEQTLAINEYKLSTKRRTGILPPILILPAFIRYHEGVAEGLPPNSTTRQVFREWE